MKCHVDWQWGTDTYNVFLYHALPNGSTMLLKHVEGDAWREEEIAPGGTLTPTISLHTQWIEVLAKELAKIPTADDATVAHLKDARETRDRLLRVVEHKMGVKP